MRINLIIPSFYPATIYGGPIFSTLNTCKSLSELDEVVIYVSTTNTNKNSKLDVEVNRWVKFNNCFFVKYYDETKIGKFSLTFFLNVWKDIKKSDVVHLQGIFSSPTPITLIYCFLLNKSILMSPRGSLNEWCLAQGSHFKKLWMKLFISPFTNYINWHATSETEKEDILKLFPASNVFVIPNGISLNSFSNVNFLKNDEYIHKYLGKVLQPSKIIVSMGRLHQVKGFDILINSFLEVLKIYPSAILLIAGKNAGEKGNLEILVHEHKMENSIYFVGEVSDQDKIDFFANADLFVLPSHSENFGNVYLESLAAGTPIVASKNTPWAEVEEADCGRWVDNSVAETASAMIEILDSNRDTMRKNSKNCAKKYDWENIAVQFKNVFNEMVI